MREPVYSFPAIRHLVGWLAAGERGWTQWLRGRDPDVVVYEDFVRDPEPLIAALTEVPAPPAPLRRQSGSLSDEWAQRFVSEAA